MNQTNYQKLKLALLRLEERYQDYLESFERPELRDSDLESIQESCIQRFETCFDTLWKHLKKYLRDETGLAELPNGPNPIFRIAGENFIIDDFEKWHDYNQKRIGTAHDYSKEKAGEVLKIIPYFIEDAIALYTKMAKETWDKKS